MYQLLQHNSVHAPPTHLVTPVLFPREAPATHHCQRQASGLGSPLLQYAWQFLYPHICMKLWPCLHSEVKLHFRVQLLQCIEARFFQGLRDSGRTPQRICIKDTCWQCVPHRFFWHRKNLLGNPLGCHFSDHCLPMVGWRLGDQVRGCTLGWHHFVRTGHLLDAGSGT